MTSSTSPSLLLRIRNSQDEDAWNQFLDVYSPIVRSYCFQRKIQYADIDDITQDVMTSVSNAIRNFEYDPSKGRFRAWFGTVTANRIKSFLGKKNRSELPQTNEDSSSDQYADPDTDWIDIFSERILRLACSQIQADFADSTWSSFEATWIRNESAADVAKSLGIQVHAVYVNKSRVLKRLEAEVRMLAEDMPISGQDFQLP